MQCKLSPLYLLPQTTMKIRSALISKIMITQHNNPSSRKKNQNHPASNRNKKLSLTAGEATKTSQKPEIKINKNEVAADHLAAGFCQIDI